MVSESRTLAIEPELIVSSSSLLMLEALPCLRDEALSGALAFRPASSLPSEPRLSAAERARA